MTILTGTDRRLSIHVHLPEGYDLKDQNRKLEDDLRKIRENDIEPLKSKLDTLASEFLEFHKSNSTTPKK